ncbi:MAG: molybdate ABC transporter substrate-binding protein [Acidobacteria bacterium]|nr:molybdate ABC transporter substrate-binding protein [Acidobacteriota bacterium]
MKLATPMVPLCIVLFLLSAVSAPLDALELSVAAAADLHSALDRIAASFESRNSVHVKIIYGSSGNFFSQIQNGARFDIFCSANTGYPRKLEEAGLVVPGTYYEYARGKIVLLVPRASRLDLKRGLKVLEDPAVKKIAIADPAHAPYGQAAVSALKSENLYDRVSAKMVTGENISQAASFVLSGAADIGIIAMSVAISPSARGETRFEEIPGDEYPPIQQACVILKSSREQRLAREFESYLQTPEARKVFEQYGFALPNPPATKSSR